MNNFAILCSAHFGLSPQPHMPIWQFVDRGTVALIAFTNAINVQSTRENFLGERNRARLLAREKRGTCRWNTRTIQQLNVWHLAGKLRIIEMKRWHWKRSVIVKRTGVIGRRKRMKQRARPRVENRVWERRNSVVIRGVRRFLPSTNPTGGPRHCSRSGINK